ncbi:MAG: hypothetical protein Tsb0019_04760 [Roseibium sp.]
MADSKIMYFNSSDDGWWAYRLENNDIWSAPQHLKVEVDIKKSSGDRYHFKVLEGPWVVKSTHYPQYFKPAQKYARGNVAKKAGGKDVLVNESPHTAAAKLVADYKAHRFIDYNGHATPVVDSKLSYAGTSKEIVMTGDLIVPNTFHPLSIPDEKHVHRNYRATKFHAMWFRIDAKTAAANFTGAGMPGDRYFHLGSASAGCFTNRYAGGDDKDWNTIANALSKARVGSNQLYVGHIKLQIVPATYAKIKTGLIAFAKAQGLKSYIWENTIHATP